MTQRNQSRGETVPVQGEQHERVPRAPHERDESSSSQAAGEPSARVVGQQGKDDLDRGVVDTTKGVELDRAYQKQQGGVKK